MNKAKKLVLLQGEGLNSHTLECTKDFAYQQHEGAIELLLKGTGVVRHDGPDETDQKHGNMVLTAGKYFTFNQIEYSPFDNDIRAVFD